MLRLHQIGRGMFASKCHDRIRISAIILWLEEVLLGGIGQQ